MIHFGVRSKMLFPESFLVVHMGIWGILEGFGRAQISQGLSCLVFLGSITSSLDARTKHKEKL